MAIRYSQKTEALMAFVFFAYVVYFLKVQQFGFYEDDFAHFGLYVDPTFPEEGPYNPLL